MLMLAQEWLVSNHDAYLLKDKQVIVWRAFASDHLINLDKYWEVLSFSERARAERFLARKKVEEFVIARGILRGLLGRYLNADPKSIVFDSNPRGKLFLANGQPLRFNLSHSNGLCLFAVTLDTEVGIDVEQIRTCAYLKIAKRYFSRYQYDRFLKLTENQRELVFFDFWSKKEAATKAVGQGIFSELMGGYFKVISLTVAPGYVGALAVDPIVTSVNLFNLSA